MQRDEKAKRKPPSLKNDAKFAFPGLLKERSRLRFFNPLVENLSRKNGFLARACALIGSLAFDDDERDAVDQQHKVCPLLRLAGADDELLSDDELVLLDELPQGAPAGDKK